MREARWCSWVGWGRFPRARTGQDSLGRPRGTLGGSCLWGCGPGNSEPRSGSSSPGGFSRSDSAGVLISVTQANDARAAIGWEVDSLPNLVIGEEDSPTGYLFRVQGVRGLSDGSVLVVDGGSRSLRFFDSDGHLVSRVGRKGKGPGEFENPVLVPTWATDSLLIIWDKNLRRFQTLSNHGEDPRTISRTKKWPGGSRPPVGAVDLHMLIRKSEMVTDLSKMRAEGPKGGGSKIPLGESVHQNRNRHSQLHGYP